MNSKNINDIISAGESENVEFKASFQKEVIESIVALANTQGGTVLIGVNDHGKVTGISVSQEMIQGYINQIKNSTEPSLIVDVIPVDIDDKTILLIKVDEFPVKPVACKGKYFKRVFNSNHQMNLTEISNMHIQSLQLSWDSYLAPDISMSDLDNEKLDRFFKKIKETGRYSLTGDAFTDLSKLNLLKNDKALTHAAKLLFVKEMTLYSIHIGRFKTPSMIIDDKMVQGTLFEAVEEAYSYILSHIKVAFEFTGELSRNEILEYPKEALRELLLNAVIHRDYTSPVDIQIKIFDNSIMFFNPGKLYGDLTVEKLKTDTYKSRARNKLIAEAFYLTGDIEKYGTGYIRIRKAIRSYPTMSFKYFEDGDGYTTELTYKTQKTDTHLVNGGVNGGVNLLIEIIKSNPGKRTNDLAELLAIPPKTCEKWLKKLRQQNKIEFRGAPKTGGYFVKE